MVDEKVHRELQDEFNRLKKELDLHKNSQNLSQENRYKNFLYSPSTNETREVPNSNTYPMSAQYKQNQNFDEIEKERSRIEIFSATKYEPNYTYQPKLYQNNIMTPIVKKED